MPADIAEALLLAMTGAAVSEEDLRNAAVDIYVIICLPESISWQVLKIQIWLLFSYTVGSCFPEWQYLNKNVLETTVTALELA